MTETRVLSFQDAALTTSIVQIEGFPPSTWEKAVPWKPTCMVALMAGMLVGTGGVANAHTVPLLYDSPVYRVWCVHQTHHQPSILIDTQERVAALRRYFSLNITDLAKVLRVERPTIYAWLQGNSAPHPGNLRRLEKIYQLSRDWRTLSAAPAGKYVREPFEHGLSLLDYLSAEVLDELAIQRALGAIKSYLDQDAVKSTMRRRSIVEVAKLHGFASVPAHIQKKNFDEETNL